MGTQMMDVLEESAGVTSNRTQTCGKHSTNMWSAEGEIAVEVGMRTWQLGPRMDAPFTKQNRSTQVLPLNTHYHHLPTVL